MRVSGQAGALVPVLDLSRVRTVAVRTGLGSGGSRPFRSRYDREVESCGLQANRTSREHGSFWLGPQSAFWSAARNRQAQDAVPHQLPDSSGGWLL